MMAKKDVETAYIYIMGPDSGPSKVGHALSAEKRAAQIAREEGRRIFVTGTWPVGAGIALAIERYVHWQLRDKHFRGEWFNVTPAEVEEAVLAALHQKLSLSALIPPIDMGDRKADYPERGTLRFAEGTFGRIDAAAGKERRATFIRRAVEAELQRCEGASATPPSA